MAAPKDSGSSIHDSTIGVLGDNHEHTPEIRLRANEIINGDDWPISDVDLSNVVFRTNTRVKRDNGRAGTRSDGRIVIEIAEHVIENAGWDAAEEVIRHELVHVWQRQHRGETVELPNGAIAEDIDTGHTGAWYEWEELLDVSRTNRHYEPSPSHFNYVIKCETCDLWIGRYRLCRYVRLAAAGRLTCGECSSSVHLVRPGDSLALKHGDWDDSAIRYFVGDDFDRETDAMYHTGGGD